MFLGKSYDKYQPIILKRIQAFKHMGDKSVLIIKVTNLCFEVISKNIQQFSSATLRAWLKVREVIDLHVIIFLQMSLTEPSQQKWISPIVFAPKYDILHRF